MFDMKIVGITLVWAGVVALLKNIGVIQFVDWSIIWPVLLIIVGASLKYVKHSTICAIGGNCGACGKGSEHKCEGPECKH
ncbi:MAG: hypothetical protein HZB10_01605 [Candidatus Yonathbacteria bacterium]|nr:hypothetical protein [Candidatus Yonathbacteria bacterium]